MFVQKDNDLVYAAKLYAWLLKRLGRRVPAWVYQAAKNNTTTDDRAYKKLTALMTNYQGRIPEEAQGVTLGDIVKEADLIAWWNEHRYDESDKLLREQALAKLSSDERRVLGLA